MLTSPSKQYSIPLKKRATSPYRAHYFSSVTKVEPLPANGNKTEYIQFLMVDQMHASRQGLTTPMSLSSHTVLTDTTASCIRAAWKSNEREGSNRRDQSFLVEHAVVEEELVERVDDGSSDKRTLDDEHGNNSEEEIKIQESDVGSEEEEDSGDEVYEPFRGKKSSALTKKRSFSKYKRVSASLICKKNKKSKYTRSNAEKQGEESEPNDGHTYKEEEEQIEDERDGSGSFVAVNSKTILSNSTRAKNHNGSNKAKNRSAQLPGITCHQCKQKTSEIKSSCQFCYLRYLKKSVIQNSQHPIPDWESYSSHFCSTCLKNRYGQDVDFKKQVLSPDWKCPICEDICNCSSCRKRANKLPYSVTTREALKKGYSSVYEMLVRENMDR